MRVPRALLPQVVRRRRQGTRDITAARKSKQLFGEHTPVLVSPLSPNPEEFTPSVSGLGIQKMGFQKELEMDWLIVMKFVNIVTSMSLLGILIVVSLLFRR